MNKTNFYKTTDRDDIIFKPLGGVSEVGATSYFIRWKDTTIIVDAGKKRYGLFDKPNYDEVTKDIDAFFITHVHGDHVGTLMEYFNYFKFKKIYATQQTIDVLLAVLEDIKKILTTDAESFYEKKAKNAKRELDLYYRQDIISKLLNTITPIQYNLEVIMTGSLSFQLINTSHLIGSCGIYLYDKSYKLFITSDFTESKKFFHPDTNFEPVYNKQIDTVITESTYGSNEDAIEVYKEDTLSALEFAVNSVFSKTTPNSRPGNIIIPVFAIGRMQEVISSLLALKNSGRISQKARICLAIPSDKTLGAKITDKYYKWYREYLESDINEILPESLSEFLNKYVEIINLYSGDLFAEDYQIVIGTPGMLGMYNRESSSPEDKAFGLIEAVLTAISSKNNGIIFVGYQSPDSLGGVIHRAKYGDIIRYLGIDYKVTTPHIYKVTYPGHVSAKGIMDMLQKIKPSNVILTHGEIESSRTVAEAITSHKIKVIVPEIEEKIYLMDNGKKSFFSMTHKYNNIISCMSDKDFFSTTNDVNGKLTISGKLDIVIKEITDKYDPKLNHILFLTERNSVSKENYKICITLLSQKGYSSDIIEIDANVIKNNLFFVFNLVSEIGMDSREKMRIYLTDEVSFINLPLLSIAQILDEDVYLVDDNKIKLLPRFPLDVKSDDTLINNVINQTDARYAEFDNGQYYYNDLYELIQRNKYYKKNTRKNSTIKSLDEYTSNQLPFYTNSVLTNQYLIKSTSLTLWGDVDTIFDIKDDVAVFIINKIADKLNQKIKSITFTNYFTGYDNHKYYGEYLCHNNSLIFYRLILEGGIQYMSIELGFNEDIIRSINDIRYIEGA